MISGDWIGPHPSTPHSNENAILGKIHLIFT